MNSTFDPDMPWKKTKVNAKLGLRSQQSRRIAIFDSESICAKMPAVLMGPPDLVVSALNAICSRLATAERVIRCSSEVSATVHRTTGESLVTIYAPWWDLLYLNISRFRKLVLDAGDIVGGVPTVIVVDDLGHRPKGLHTSEKLPQEAGARALQIMPRLHRLALVQGASLIVGVPIKDGEAYKEADKRAIGEKGYRYDLVQDESGLLAYDMGGTSHSVELSPLDLRYDRG